VSKNTCLAALILFLFMTGLWASESPLSTIENMRNRHEQSKAFQQYFIHNIQPQLTAPQTQPIDKQRLSSLLKDIEIIAFYTQDKKIARAHLDLFQKAYKQGLTNTDNTLRAYGTLLYNRLFSEAEGFYRAHPGSGLSPPPVIITRPISTFENGTVTIYFPAHNQPNTFEEKAINPLQGSFLLVLAHPLCHFCFRAATAIGQNADLVAFMKQHALWLSPPDANLSWQAFNQWNQRFPYARIKVIKYLRDFPLLTSWGTPTFYVVSNGQIVDKLVGWPDAAQLQKLKRLIQKHFPKAAPARDPQSYSIKAETNSAAL